LKNIRENIIINDDILYFDYTASGLAYAPIEEKILDILKTYANTHSEVSSSAVITNKYYEKARADLKVALELDNTFYVMPTGTGATAAIKKFQELIGIYIPPMTRKRYKVEPKNLPLVFVGPYEHHSNEISFREGLCEVIRVPLDSTQHIDLEFLEEKLKENKNREITFAGGGTVAYVSRKSHEFLSDKELIEDAGTPGIIQFIRASLAYNLRNEIGLKKIADTERDLKKYFGTRAKQIEGLKLFCSFAQEKLPIFSIIFQNSNPFDISQYLSDNFNIQTRAGCSCAGPYGHDLLELEDGQEFDTKPGWLRISVHFTHTEDEIDTLIQAIKDAIKHYS